MNRFVLRAFKSYRHTSLYTAHNIARRSHSIGEYITDVGKLIAGEPTAVDPSSKWKTELSGGLGLDPSVYEGYRPSNVLWLSNIFEGGRLTLLYRTYFQRENLARELQLIEDQLRRQMFPRVSIKKIVASYKTQGCFLHFGSVAEAERAMTIPIHRADSRLHMCQGRPFIEDYLNFHPTTRLFVRHRNNSEIVQENVFQEFRQFGRMRSITVASDRKSCVVTFLRRRDAISAQMCLHQKMMPHDEVLSVRFVQSQILYKTWEMLKNTKVGLLLMALAFAVASFLILSPIRNYLVTQRLALGYREPWLEREVDLDDTFVWSHKTDTEAQLQTIFDSKPSAITILCGEKGTLKSMVIRKVLNHRRGSLLIDCSDSDSVQDFIDVLEKAISFRPSFTGMNQLRETMLAAASFGAKNAAIDSKSVQLNEILSTLKNAIYALSLRHPRDATQTHQYNVIVFDGFHRLIKSMEAQSAKDAAIAAELLDTLVSWSEQANVVFVTDDVFAEDRLKKGFPSLRGNVNRVVMSDTLRNDAQQYLKDRISWLSDAQRSDEEVDDVLAKVWQVIGGRNVALETLVDRCALDGRTTVLSALEEIVSDETRAFIESAFGALVFKDTKELGWSSYRLWQTILAFGGLHSKVKPVALTCVHPEAQNWPFVYLPYDEVLLGLFRGDEASIKQLVKENLLTVIRVVQDGETKSYLRANSPLLQVVVLQLVHEAPEFRMGMDAMCAMVDIGKQEEEISKLEVELVALNKANARGAGAIERRRVLDERLTLLNKKIAKNEKVLNALLAASKLSIKQRWRFAHALQ